MSECGHVFVCSKCGKVLSLKDAAKFLAAEAGGCGGKARAAALSPARRKEIAKMGGRARWNKEKPGHKKHPAGIEHSLAIEGDSLIPESDLDLQS